jgi:hypothetical protein
MALKLAGCGYCGGDPEKVLEMRADLALAAFQYEAFKQEYEREFIALNSPEK